MIKKPEILIIGGTGFIGSYVTRVLCDNSNSVAVIHRHPINSHQAMRGVTYHRTFAPNQKWSKNIQTIVIVVQPDPLVFESIIKFMGALPKLKKVVYLSTTQLYPDSPRKQGETVAVMPLSEYERNKYYEELALCQFLGKRRIYFCIARLSNVYGDVQNKGIINLLVRQILYQTELTINGDGSQKKRPYFYRRYRRVNSLSCNTRATSSV